MAIAISQGKKTLLWVCGLVLCALAFIFLLVGCVTAGWKIVEKNGRVGQFSFEQYNLVTMTGLWYVIRCLDRKCKQFQFGDRDFGVVIESPPNESSNQSLAVVAIVFCFVAIVVIATSRCLHGFVVAHVVARLSAVVLCILSFILAVVPCARNGTELRDLQEDLNIAEAMYPNSYTTTKILFPFSVLLFCMGAALAFLAAVPIVLDLFFLAKDPESQFDSISESGSMMNYSCTSYPENDPNKANGNVGGTRLNPKRKLKGSRGSRDSLNNSMSTIDNPVYSITPMKTNRSYRTPSPSRYGSNRRLDSENVLQVFALENALHGMEKSSSQRSSRRRLDLDSDNESHTTRNMENQRRERSKKGVEDTDKDTDKESDFSERGIEPGHGRFVKPKYSQQRNGEERHVGLRADSQNRLQENKVKQSYNLENEIPSIDASSDSGRTESDKSTDKSIDYSEADSEDSEVDTQIVEMKGSQGTGRKMRKRGKRSHDKKPEQDVTTSKHYNELSNTKLQDNETNVNNDLEHDVGENPNDKRKGNESENTPDPQRQHISEESENTPDPQRQHISEEKEQRPYSARKTRSQIRSMETDSGIHTDGGEVNKAFEKRETTF